MKVLVLGGSAEARELAERLHPAYDVVSSLAGRVPDPALPAGEVRVGGFGGAEQMRQWLVENGIDAVVDATHPFATVITERTADLCADLGLPHVVLARPAWDSRDAIAVASASEAADVIDDFGYSRVFLTSGRSTIGAFKRSRAWYLVRLVIAPDADALPLNYTLLTSRGPYCYDDEVALMRKYRTHVLVTKNSGGDYTRAKLDAAAALYIPIIMIDRPALPAGVASVASVDEAASWLA